MIDYFNNNLTQYFPSVCGHCLDHIKALVSENLETILQTNVSQPLLVVIILFTSSNIEREKTNNNNKNNVLSNLATLMHIVW